ncbi:hypothetical protein GCM10023079_00970 [Streptomyces chitinivorans]
MEAVLAVPEVEDEDVALAVERGHGCSFGREWNRPRPLVIFPSGNLLTGNGDGRMLPSRPPGHIPGTGPPDLTHRTKGS